MFKFFSDLNIKYYLIQMEKKDYLDSKLENIEMIDNRKNQMFF